MIKYSYRSDGLINSHEQHSKDCSTVGVVDSEQQQELIDSGVDITDYIKPAKTLDDVRAEREPLFSAHVDKYGGSWWSALTANQKEQVNTYRAELKDITTQDPTDVTWPTPPSF
jgi:hypothetical protein